VKMLDLYFKFGTEVIAIRIDGTNLTFSKVQGNWVKYAPIEGLRFSKEGILKEFPDLKDKPFEEMKRIAIQRFKEHIKKLQDEEKIAEYLKQDLAKHGYELLAIHKKGFRPIVVK